MTGQGRPLPVVHPENREFWEALGRHELRLQRCAECGFLRYPISPVCPECLATASEWVRLSGRGTLVASVVVHRATGDPWWGAQTPFAVALVRLEEGPRLKAALSTTAAARLKPGDAVVATFDDVDGATLLRFEPAN